MSLKTFHIVFISISGLLGVCLCIAGFRGYFGSGNQTDLMLGISGLGLLVFLVPYFRWFQKKMQKLQIAVIVLLTPLLPDIANACAVCFGDPNSPLVKGARLGILFLGGVVVLVLGTIAGVAFTWSRRARALE